MGGENAQSGGEWDWLEDSALRLMCALIFARDVTQDQVFEAFGLDPAAARMEDRASGPGRVAMGRLATVTLEAGR